MVVVVSNVYLYLKRVRWYGSALTILIPVELASALGLKHGSEFYVYLDHERNRLIYSLDPLPDPPSEPVRVRLRTVARRENGREYYAVTVPARFARALGIEDGTIVEIEGRAGSRFFTVTPRAVSSM